MVNKPINATRLTDERMNLHFLLPDFSRLYHEFLDTNENSEIILGRCIRMRIVKTRSRPYEPRTGSVRRARRSLIVPAERATFRVKPWSAEKSWTSHTRGDWLRDGSRQQLVGPLCCHAWLGVQLVRLAKGPTRLWPATRVRTSIWPAVDKRFYGNEKSIADMLLLVMMRTPQ